MKSVVAAFLMMLHLGLFVTNQAMAQNKKGAAIAPTKGSGFTMVPELIRVKSYLEELMVNRFNRDVATIVDKDSFTLGVQLDIFENLEKKTKPVEEDEETLNDLNLGIIDPDDIVKKYSIEKESNLSVLSNYKIKSLSVNLGLKEQIGEATKAEVEKWLTDRLRSEFGANAKAKVAYIKMPDKKVDPPKNILDWLDQFQSLAGQAVLAIALILIALLWKILSSSTAIKFTPAGEFPTINLNGGKGESASHQQMKVEQLQKEMETQEKLKLSEEIDKVSTKMKELLNKNQIDLEKVARIWSQGGEVGRIKLACFAEAVGREVGKIPIPEEALKEVSKVFANMIQMSLQEKLDHLNKTYWDLMTAMNIGTDSLSQPFGYMGSMSLDSISQLLIDQNPKMKTVISLYLPMELRIRYLKSLTIEAKKEILDTAISLNEIEESEVKLTDNKILSKLSPTGGKDFIPLEMSFNKIVNALSPLEEVVLLAEMDHPGLSNFKRTTPTIAFIHEWPDDKLQKLLSQVPSDELEPYTL